MTEDWAPPNDIDFTTPNVARMYDYLLGGKENYAPDRAAAEQVIAAAPDIRRIVWENRWFLERVVRFLSAEAGIRQFIDIGAGLPTQSSVHEVAHEAQPDATVVYVDNDPVVINHGLDLLSGVDEATIVEVDMRRPEEFIDHPRLREFIDFDRPVAVLLMFMLHWLPDHENPASIVTRLREVMAPGSYLALSHATGERRPEAMEEIQRVYEQSSSPGTLRSTQWIRGLFDGFELVEPGLVYMSEWRPDDPATAGDPERAWAALAGVGRKP